MAGVLGPAKADDEHTATDINVFSNLDMANDRRIPTDLMPGRRYEPA
jgi:hypothetical protein